MTNPIIDEAIKRFMDRYFSGAKNKQMVGQIKGDLTQLLQTAITKKGESVVEEIREWADNQIIPENERDTEGSMNWHQQEGSNRATDGLRKLLTTLLTTSKEKDE